MRLRSLLVIVMCLLVASSAAYGQRNKLRTGRAAPGLDVERWINGSEVTIQKEHCYLIAFIKTDEPASQAIIPVLSEIQENNGWMGLTVVGVTEQKPSDVSRWMRSNGDKVKFTIAVDRRSGSSRAWMQASGNERLPTIFLVGKQSRVQYIGRFDAEKLNEILPKLLDGRYDASMAQQAENAINQAKQARKMRNWRMCFKTLDDIIASDPHLFALLTLEKFEIMLVDQNDRAAAYEYANELLLDYSNDPTLLAKLAEKIATDPKIEDEKRDFDIALRAAEAAAQAVTVPSDPEQYAIQALVHYHAGHPEKAIELQKKAYFVARPNVKEHYKHTLDTYREGAKREATMRKQGQG